MAQALSDAEKRARAAMLTVSTRAHMLVAASDDATFCCGEWDSDTGTTYQSVLDLAAEASAALYEYIAELESRAARLP
jgi:hypothetical protein